MKQKADKRTKERADGMTEEIKIGEILKELRRSKGVSQENLAELCGVSMQAVSKWENGQSFPDITFLPKLAGYFQVTIDTLLLGRRIMKRRERIFIVKQSEEMWKRKIFLRAKSGRM